MKPFHEVANKIRYTDTLDERDFTVGYRDRMALKGHTEVTLGEFLETGEVPEHRVLWIKDSEGVFVWHREERICTI